MANLFMCSGGNKIVFDKIHLTLSIWNTSSYSSTLFSEVKMQVKGFSKVNIGGVTFTSGKTTPYGIRGYDASGNATVIATNPTANTEYDISQYDSIEFYVSVVTEQPDVTLENVVIS